MAAENRVLRLEECDCKKSCNINDTIKDDGEQWIYKCDRCKCIQGEVKCTKNCEEINCKFPQPVEGECCPKCLGNGLYLVLFYLYIYMQTYHHHYIIKV